MSKFTLPLLLLILLFSAAPAIPAGPALADISDDVRAGAFVLMDAGTGQVLLERDMHAALKPASITKIMTALLALENSAPDASVTVSAAAVAANAKDGSSVGFMPGEVIDLEDVLYALMLESANEAANALAEFVSGTMEEFAALMNRRAQELGAESTHFANANGLNDENHYTSAYDMALITREAIRSPRFLRVWGTYQHFLPPTNLQTEQRVFNNKNRLLTQGSMPYRGILGGKTGYTTASQNTLVEAARRDGRTLICVLLQGPGAVANFQDATNLLNYGFDAFRSVTYEDEAYSDSFTFLLHKDLDFEDVSASFGEPAENEDGSITVPVVFGAPPDSTELMHSPIAYAAFTTPIPEAAAPEPGLTLFDKGWIERLWALLTQSAPYRIVSGFFLYMSQIPAWLAFTLRIILGLFSTLFVLACIFRTRRWLRRRKRRLARMREAARRRAYRQKSTWS